MTSAIPVFVNGTRVEIEPGATALDAVRRWDPVAARLVEAGGRDITDSRGLRLDAATPVFPGAIFRLASAREADAASADNDVN
ncbi:MAG: hypothetical protein ACREOJ_18775 [Gemmatimonadaceae bacterium]